MKFGFCTGFATRPRFVLDVPLVRRIHAAGYDFPDFPIMAFEHADEAMVEAVAEAMGRGTVCPVACNLIPGRLKLVGPLVDAGALRVYLDKVLPILGRFGVKDLVLGSAGARMLEAGTDEEEGKRQFSRTLRTVLIPACTAHGMRILLEPLNRKECNLLHTVRECARFVRDVQDDGLWLMVDLYHMQENGEDPEDLSEVLPLVRHVHVAERDRALPGASFSPYVARCLAIIREAGYDGTISYETVDGADLRAPLALLKDSMRRNA